MAHSAKSITEKTIDYGEVNSARTLHDSYVATQTKSAYRNSWISENLDRVNLTMPKGKKEQIKAVADQIGMSLNSYINTAIDEKIERDNNSEGV